MNESFKNYVLFGTTTFPFIEKELLEDSKVDCHTLGDIFFNEPTDYEKLFAHDIIAQATVSSIVFGDWHTPPDSFYVDKVVEENFRFRFMMFSHRDTSWKFGNANNIDFMETLIKLMRENHKPDYFEYFNYTIENIPSWRLEAIGRASFTNIKRGIS